MGTLHTVVVEMHGPSLAERVRKLLHEAEEGSVEVGLGCKGKKGKKRGRVA